MGDTLRKAGNSALALIVAGGLGFGAQQAVSVASAQEIDPGCSLVGGGSCDTGPECRGTCTPLPGECEYYTGYVPGIGFLPGCDCHCIYPT